MFITETPPQSRTHSAETFTSLYVAQEMTTANPVEVFIYVGPFGWVRVHFEVTETRRDSRPTNGAERVALRKPRCNDYPRLDRFDDDFFPGTQSLPVKLRKTKKTGSTDSSTWRTMVQEEFLRSVRAEEGMELFEQRSAATKTPTSAAADCVPFPYHCKPRSSTRATTRRRRSRKTAKEVQPTARLVEEVKATVNQSFDRLPGRPAAFKKPEPRRSEQETVQSEAPNVDQNENQSDGKSLRKRKAESTEFKLSTLEDRAFTKQKTIY